MHQAEQWDLCVCVWGGTMGDQELEFSSMLDCMSEQRSVVFRATPVPIISLLATECFNCLSLNIWVQETQTQDDRNAEVGAMCRLAVFMSFFASVRFSESGPRSVLTHLGTGQMCNLIHVYQREHTHTDTHSC